MFFLRRATVKSSFPSSVSTKAIEIDELNCFISIQFNFYIHSIITNCFISYINEFIHSNL